jgi:hypothetical protein
MSMPNPTPSPKPVIPGRFPKATTDRLKRVAKAKAQKKVDKANKSWGENYGYGVTNVNYLKSKSEADAARRSSKVAQDMVDVTLNPETSTPAEFKRAWNSPLGKAATKASLASDAAYKRQQKAYEDRSLAQDQRDSAKRVVWKTPAMLDSEAANKKKKK